MLVVQDDLPVPWLDVTFSGFLREPQTPALDHETLGKKEKGKGKGKEKFVKQTIIHARVPGPRSNPPSKLVTTHWSLARLVLDQ